MALITLKNAHLSFGGPKILNGVDLKVDTGERICLIGRNGTGKTSLFKVLQAQLPLDGGEVLRAQGLKVCTLDQTVPEYLKGSVLDAIVAGAGQDGQKLIDYHKCSHELEQDCSDKLLAKFERLQAALDAGDLWSLDQRAEAMISRMELDPNQDVSVLSAGLKRRVMLGQALIQNPEILLLDEPTNHLDMPSIQWLEKFLKREEVTVLFITHDRMFLRYLATRIVELDRGRVYDFDCDYDTYLERREAQLEIEETHNALFDKNLAKEEVWVRQGIKARRTRNEGRVRDLEKLRTERGERRNRPKQMKLTIQEGVKTGRKVLEAKKLSFSWGKENVFSDFSTLVMRGDRVGILGPNGCGKTTLIKVLLGQLPAESGEVEMGTNHEVAYFDQLHDQLDDRLTLKENVIDSDYVDVNGNKKHILGYLQDFLFSPEQARGSITQLSGGERNRLLLAKMFSKPSNILVLDEPTNDLDSDTLDLLIDRLTEYTGTIFTVSHDRDFLNRIATSVFVFEEPGKLAEYIGGYDDWLRQKKKAPVSGKKSSKKPNTEEHKNKQKVSQNLMKKIDALEMEISKLDKRMADPEFYNSDTKQVEDAIENKKTYDAELKEMYQQWEENEAE